MSEMRCSKGERDILFGRSAVLFRTLLPRYLGQGLRRALRHGDLSRGGSLLAREEAHTPAKNSMVFSVCG